MDQLPKPSFFSSPTALNLFGLSILGYGWQVHGLLIGLGLAVLYYLLVLIANLIALERFQNLRWTTISRIVVFVLIMAGIALTGSQVCSADGLCRSLL